ncbi:hypothetical protein O181_038124 [Austropuccinia psidii MF-1]|uniref:Uncharacterized protein n=1 Tax=Austropuccinia psidii MF-1 TaxID=1389203 RepID=A0A9Q3D7R3_9BASI|nr:hypothetical protein [Austropuccinia psidii MF-1]
MEKTLGCLGNNVIVPHSGKNSGHMSEMFFFRLGKKHNLIQIKNEINICKIRENIIEKIFKTDRNIGEPKWHNQVPIAAIFSSECCQTSITFPDYEQVICTMKINLGEYRRTIKDSKKLIHRSNRIFILPSNRIEFVIINTQTEAPSSFLTKRTGAPVEEELGWMKPFSTFSEM